MANRRMISSDIFEDDFIGSLSFFERLVWIGLFAVCADDQGRCLDNPAIIRAKVFPYDRNVDDSKVEAAMEQAARAGKVMRYVSSTGTRLLQVINWWQYQTPSWASPSKYPAPEGWIDRIKYHAPGNKIVLQNWELPGGFDTHLSTPLRSTLPTPLHSGIEEDDVKDDVKRRGEEKEPETAAAAVFSAYSREIGALTPMIAEKIQSALEDYPPDWTIAALEEAARHNKRSWSYAEAILKRWKVEGFKSNTKSNGKHPPEHRVQEQSEEQTRKNAEILLSLRGKT